MVILVDEVERVFPHFTLGERVRSEADAFNRRAGILRAVGQEAGETMIAPVLADLRPDFTRVNSFRIEGVDANPFYRFFQERFVAPLDVDETREMVSEIAHAMGLSIDEEAQRRIFDDSGGYPAPACQLASKASHLRTGERITVTDYQRGLAEFESDGSVDDYFRNNLWGPATEAERAILQTAAFDGAVVEDRPARQSLFAFGVIEAIEDRYRVRGRLFREWLAGKADEMRASP